MKKSSEFFLVKIGGQASNLLINLLFYFQTNRKHIFNEFFGKLRKLDFADLKIF